ncbi:ATP-binding protein [Granulosicoccus sp. 3-233]
MVVFIAINLAIFIGGKIEMAMVYNEGEPFYVGQYRGTFDLLDDAIVERAGVDLQATLVALKTQFKTPLRLEYQQELDLPPKGWEIIANEAVYLHDLGNSISLYRKSIIPGRVWSLPVVTPYVDERIAHVSGTLSLIKGKLSAMDAGTRALAMEELRRSYDVPLALKSISELDLSAKEISLLQAEQIVVKNPLESGEVFLVKLGKSSVVFQFGPIDYPASFEDRTWYGAIILTAIALTFFLLWIWPLWRDLQRLRRASFDIGDGKLGTRVRSHPASLIKPILDSFNSMATRTENMVESQRELTNAVSHELRTPLARMMFDLQMARDADNVLEQSRHLDSLEINVGELNTLVDELLTYARQERVESPLEFEALSAEDMKAWLVKQVSRAQHGREGKCQITVNFDTTNIGEKSFIISPRLMAHALSNTLQNAFRYAQGNIVVQLDSQQGEWVLGVEDDGAGIPDDKHERVFEPFSRLDESRQRGSGGFGMGLSIVRKIAQWHQGNALIAECKTLSGTRVEIRWPIEVEFD